MPTENPKISAYVPQVVYDRFKQFKEERNLSFSQAAIEVFVEYFDIDLASNSIRENTGGLLDRVAQLEQLVVDLKQSYVYLSQKVDLMQSTSELPNKLTDYQSEPLSILPDSDLPSEPLNELPNQSLSELPSEPGDELTAEEPLIEPENSLVENSSLLSEPKSTIPNLLSYQLGIVESGNTGSNGLLTNLPSELDIKINHAVLAQRLGRTEGYIKNKKSTSGSSQEFTKWSTEKDPDKIGWESIKEGRSVYFIPAGNLSDEQKANLQDWFAKNQNPAE